MTEKQDRAAKSLTRLEARLSWVQTEELKVVEALSGAVEKHSEAAEYARLLADDLKALRLEREREAKAAAKAKAIDDIAHLAQIDDVEALVARLKDVEALVAGLKELDPGRLFLGGDEEDVEEMSDRVRELESRIAEAV